MSQEDRETQDLDQERSRHENGCSFEGVCVEREREREGESVSQARERRVTTHEESRWSSRGDRESSLGSAKRTNPGTVGSLAPMHTTPPSSPPME
jgi:hypothetical protein